MAMDYKASSAKEKLDELQKNPLVFYEYEPVNVQDGMGHKHSTEGWNSCDSTFNFLLYEKDLPHNNKMRRLFVIGKQILSNGKVDEKKEGRDIVDFELIQSYWAA